MSGFDDFDFLIGEWKITNEFLRGRLVGSADWETFPATSKVEKVMPIPDGAFAGGLAAISTPCSCRRAGLPA